MRDAETGAWRSRGKLPHFAPFSFGWRRTSTKPLRGTWTKTNKGKVGGNVGLEFEDANYFHFHARNQPSYPSRHEPPTRELPLSFLYLFSVFLSFLSRFSVFSTVNRPSHPSVNSGGPGNSTTCSMLPPGNATSPALDCTMYNVRGVFCDLALASTGAVPLLPQGVG